MSFQSLSGFQVRCNVGTEGRSRAGLQVSIPIGFSSSLQPVLNVLYSLPVNRFQSLSGFQVRCNYIFIALHVEQGLVSIPIGFSSSLQLIQNLSIQSGLKSFNPYRVFKFVATDTWPSRM